MFNARLSDGVIAYVGVAGRYDTRSPEERVTGAELSDLLPAVQAIMSALNTADPPLHHHRDIADVGRAAEHFLRQQYPELSDAAVTAAVRRFTYEWR